MSKSIGTMFFSRWVATLFCAGFVMAADTGASQLRSADWQSAVSPVVNRQGSAALKLVTFVPNAGQLSQRKSDISEMRPADPLAESGTKPGASWDTYSETWVATDGLGRSLPGYDQVGPLRDKKFVAMFYFLWHGRHGEAGPFDNTKILAADPGAMSKPESSLWGPLYAPHHWGESIFGYYLSDDDGVLRKHAQMLADAGIDVVIFDVTNGFTYPESYRALMRVFAEARQHGRPVPQIAFLCPFGDPRKVVVDLWQNLYERGLNPELWFRWDGKPLILADPAYFQDDETRQIRNFFTFRKPQPDYFQGPTGPDQWSWLEIYPQHIFKNARGEKEMMSVGVAQNAVGHRLGSMSEPGAKGRSFHNGATDQSLGAVRLGLNFSEQWSRALSEDPQLIFITGWNEWIAGRFNEFNKVRLPVMFVDQFDQEHSRDIEPMKGGHGDDYYYQLIANVRRFKGARPIPPVRSRPIKIDGQFDDWRDVSPEFRDDIGDPVVRDYKGWGNAGRYVNRTGRNDIVAAKISMDESNVCFYVRAQQPLTPCADPNWMMLFINADQNSTNGWLGYDFVVNRTGVNSQSTTLEKHSGHGWNWGSPEKVEYRTSGNELELVIPRAKLGLGRVPMTLEFKWADNIQQTGDWSDFTVNGDAAPNDRFNYRAVFDNASGKP